MEDLSTIDQIINDFNLEEHPEGGYFRETYRSNEIIERQNGQERTAGTAIYFLLTEGICTNWHRVTSDELWHYYMGDKLVLEIIDQNGKYNRLLLDDGINGKGQFQQLIPKNCWQRAYSTGEYTLVGCTVSPGFEFEDFEMIEADELADQFPDVRSKIVRNPF